MTTKKFNDILKPQHKFIDKPNSKKDFPVAGLTINSPTQMNAGKEKSDHAASGIRREAILPGTGAEKLGTVSNGIKFSLKALQRQGKERS